MCYSLPTVENPFLDEKERAFRMTHGKKVNPEAPKAKRAKALQAEQENANPGLAAKASETKPAKIKVSWPKGDQGKARITAVSDPRLPEVFRSAAESLSVNAPSSFQTDVWQAALRGQGVLGFCGGVSGDVLHDPLMGYLLPAVQHMKAQEQGKRGQGPVVLILVPNRERGAQVSASHAPRAGLVSPCCRKSVSWFGPVGIGGGHELWLRHMFPLLQVMKVQEEG
jgi:hypothetical protein